MLYDSVHFLYTSYMASEEISVRPTRKMNIQQLYYINLESRPDRRNAMEAMFEKHGVTANRCVAIVDILPLKMSTG